VSRLRIVLALVVIAAAAACGRTDSAAALPFTIALPAASSAPQTAPPRCKGQHGTKKYAQSNITLKKHEANFCVPAFHGYGGTIEYPAVGRPAPLVLRSAITNLYDDPLLGTTGMPTFYLNLHFRASASFGTQFGSAGGLTGGEIVAGQGYTAYGIVTVGHLALMLTPCTTIATQGPYGGVLSDLGSMFAGKTVTGAGYGVIEIYSGAQLSQQC
jgi:hypothetical protein